MAIVYRIYRNTGLGDAIDYSSPIAEVATPSFVTGPLVAPGDYLFGVRSFDSTTNLEEANTNIRARLILDESGVDVTRRPSAPFALNIRLTSLGAQVSWCHRTIQPSGPPTGFHVYCSPNSAVDYSVPAATVAYSTATLFYSTELKPLLPGNVYTVSVRAFNGISEELNVLNSTFTITQSKLSPVDNFVASTCLGR